MPRDVRPRRRIGGADVIRWALLDRDGTLNNPAPSGEYVSDADAVMLRPGAAQAVLRLNEALEAVMVTTNQRGVALGLMSVADVLRVNASISELLACERAHVDGYFVCPHDVDACDCRKPLPGLLYEASRQCGLPLAHAVMVGDSEIDVEAALAAGATAVRIGRHDVATAAAETACSLAAAVELLLSQRLAT